MNQDSDEIIKNGYLMKAPQWNSFWPLKRRWRRRFFVLRKPPGGLFNDFKFEYYLHDDRQKKLGEIDLQNLEQAVSDLRINYPRYKYQYILGLLTVQKEKKREYYLAADSEVEMQDWLSCIVRVCGLQAGDHITNINNRHSDTANHQDWVGGPNLMPTLSNNRQNRSNGNLPTRYPGSSTTSTPVSGSPSATLSPRHLRDGLHQSTSTLTTPSVGRSRHSRQISSESPPSEPPPLPPESSPAQPPPQPLPQLPPQPPLQPPPLPPRPYRDTHEYKNTCAANPIPISEHVYTPASMAVASLPPSSPYQNGWEASHPPHTAADRASSASTLTPSTPAVGYDATGVFVLNDGEMYNMPSISTELGSELYHTPSMGGAALMRGNVAATGQWRSTADENYVHMADMYTGPPACTPSPSHSQASQGSAPLHRRPDSAYGDSAGKPHSSSSSQTHSDSDDLSEHSVNAASATARTAVAPAVPPPPLPLPAPQSALTDSSPRNNYENVGFELTMHSQTYCRAPHVDGVLHVDYGTSVSVQHQTPPAAISAKQPLRPPTASRCVPPPVVNMNRLVNVPPPVGPAASTSAAGASGLSATTGRPKQRPLNTDYIDLHRPASPKASWPTNSHLPSRPFAVHEPPVSDLVSTSASGNQSSMDYRDLDAGKTKALEQTRKYFENQTIGK